MLNSGFATKQMGRCFSFIDLYFGYFFHLMHIYLVLLVFGFANLKLIVTFWFCFSGCIITQICLQVSSRYYRNEYVEDQLVTPVLGAMLGWYYIVSLQHLLLHMQLDISWYLQVCYPGDLVTGKILCTSPIDWHTFHLVQHFQNVDQGLSHSLRVHVETKHCAIGRQRTFTEFISEKRP